MKSLLSRSAFLFLSLCGLAHGQGSLPPTVESPILGQGIFINPFPNNVSFYGTVNPNGTATTAQFEYGLTSSYGSVLPATLGAPVAVSAQFVAANAPGLSPNTIYHYRLTATNAHGTSSTPDRMIRTADYAFQINYLAGTTGGMGLTDGLGGTARFAFPWGISSAPGGHFYVVDRFAQTIRKVTAEGMVTTFAGSAGLPGSEDGVGPSARFAGPNDVAVDAGGNLYVTDTGNSTIRKITSLGVVTTLAGAAGMSGSADGTGNTARFSIPVSIAVDATGNVYVSDNQTIRKITASGHVTTLAGLAGSSGSADGPGSTARFNSPEGLAMASDGHLLVADRSNHTIRRINTTTGVVGTLAGLAGISGTTDGTISQARFNSPSSLAVGADGTIYVPSYNGIRKITAAGVVSTLNSTGDDLLPWADLTVGLSGQMVFTKAVLGLPAVFIRDSAGAVSVLAGLPPESGSSDGPAETARFNQPAGAGMDGDGNFYVADQANHTIRKISASGVVTTFAGMPGISGNTDGVGSAARFTSPSDLAVDGAGYVFVATANSVRKITPAGSVSTLANLGNVSYINKAIALDGSGNVFVTNDHSIQKITSGGLLSTFAGDKSASGSLDETGTNARFNQPQGMVVGAANNLYVADSFNHTIRRVTPAGVVTTFAGVAGAVGIEDGPSTSAKFVNPNRLCLDEGGNLIVGSFSTLRRISPSGDVSSFGLVDLGSGLSFSLSNPSGILSIPGGSFFLVDLQHKVQRLTPGPLVGRRPVSGLNTTSATLNARLDPNAATTTTALFEYGTSTIYGSTAAVTLSPDSGVAEQSVSASLSGLLPATTYHYRLTATNARGTNTTSNGTFTTLNLQQGWRQTYFGSPTNEGNAADTFDHDGDGIVNLLEWATGLNPTINSTLPASSTVSGTDIEYHYTRLVAAIAAGAIFTVEWNDTLSPLGWSSAGVVETILSNNGTTQQVKATLPAGSSGKRFVRLRVTGAP
ncbi:MAG: hypothetical protein IPK22_06290 [Verrucomicrobiaceae bacterium]|nr:hypothetical protein [Verrucomicrobiaceae bacterium]